MTTTRGGQKPFSPNATPPAAISRPFDIADRQDVNHHMRFLIGRPRMFRGSRPVSSGSEEWRRRRRPVAMIEPAGSFATSSG